MRIPVIKASNAVTASGVAISKKAEQYVERFKKAFDHDGPEEEIADKVYEIHQEIAADHETYIEVGDALGSRLRRALHTYVTIKWSER